MAEVNVKTDNVSAGSAESAGNAELDLNQESIIPNRIFIGGISHQATEWDLKQKFANFGHVRAAKIIRDEMGTSKGYGFVTFGSEAEAKRALDKGHVMLRGKKLNIAPAIKKQSSYSNAESNTKIAPVNNYLDSPRNRYKKSPRRGGRNFHRSLEFSRTEVTENHPHPVPVAYEEREQSLITATTTTTTEMPSIYGNNQVNLISYPTVIYVPQQAFQYSGQITQTYQVGPMQEVIQIISPPNMYYFNQQN